jgi:Ca-activated chloride channel family protein
MFQYPQSLLLLVLLPVMMGVYAWREQVRARRLGRIGDTAAVQRLLTGTEAWQGRAQLGLWLAALAALIIALAQPVWGVDAEVVETRGAAIMIVLDVSASMDAQDVLPSRLERAKLAIRELMQGAEGNLFGLILFAGDAFVQFPLTSDIDSALTFVDAASSRAISRQGTVIEDALRLALATFDARISSASIIVLMTDGENHEGDPLAVAQAAAEAGITIHVIGYGTPDGDVIPVFDAAGNLVEYKTDRGNNLVITRLNEPILEQIAGAANGLYQRAVPSGVEMVNLQNRIAEIEGDLLATRFQTRPVPRFGVFLALALLALSIEMLWSDGHFSRAIFRQPYEQRKEDAV